MVAISAMFSCLEIKGNEGRGMQVAEQNAERKLRFGFNKEEVDLKSLTSL
jgi:hypothetical protein